MPTECSAESFDFGTVKGRPVEAAVDGRLVMPDAGALLPGATDRAIDLVDQFALCFHDERRPELIEHSVATLVRQWVFGIALGYHRQAAPRAARPILRARYDPRTARASTRRSGRGCFRSRGASPAGCRGSRCGEGPGRRFPTQAAGAPSAAGASAARAPRPPRTDRVPLLRRQRTAQDRRGRDRDAGARADQRLVGRIEPDHILHPAKSLSRKTLKVLIKCGLSLWARHIREHCCKDTAAAAAELRALHCVAMGGFAYSVMSTTCLIFSGVNGLTCDRRVASFRSPSTPLAT
jgi:hypothetical protein